MSKEGQKKTPFLLACLRLNGKLNPHPSLSLCLAGTRFHLQQTIHDESDTCHQGDHNTGNENDVNDFAVLMIDIPDFRISMDLIPQHDDLQKLEVDNLGS